MSGKEKLSPWQSEVIRRIGASDELSRRVNKSSRSDMRIGISNARFTSDRKYVSLDTLFRLKELGLIEVTEVETEHGWGSTFKDVVALKK